MRKFFIAILGMLLACWGTRPNAGPATHRAGGNVAAPAGQAKLRFLALGDSYTIGEGVQPAQRWPVQLATLLRNEGIAVADPTIIATTGWTTGELLSGIDRARPHGRYDIVSLLIGVNNQYRGLSGNEYRREFATLLTRAVQFAGDDASRVLVLSIPDWGVTPFAAGRDQTRISSEIDRFNAINREESEAAGVRYVDVTPGSRLAASDRGLLAGDGLHPSGRMYREWAELSLPAASEALNR